MGDLVLTCTGSLSRNRGLGIALAKGEALEQVEGETRMIAEGARTVRSALALASRHGVSLPICEEVAAVLFQGKSPAAALTALLGRAPTREDRLSMPELRKDPVVGRWVIISTERARRPTDFQREPVRPRGRQLRLLSRATRTRRRPRSWPAAPAGGFPNSPGWTLSRRGEQVSGAAHRGRARAHGRGSLRPHERRGRARGRDRDARSPAPRWRRMSVEAIGRSAARVSRADPRPQEGPALRVRPGLQEPRRGRGRVAGAPALAAHRHARSFRSW